MFPNGYNYIYVFSVPLFFFISGYLCHREDSSRLFWKKLLFNLIIPMLCYSVLNYLFIAVPAVLKGTFDPNTLWRLLVNIFIGNQGENYARIGLLGMWFVYTLCVLKIILQLIPERFETLLFVLLLLLCISGDIELFNKGIEVFNSWMNVLTAIPFFYIGYLMRKHNSILGKKLNIVQIFIALCSIGIIFICGKNNDTVFMYQARYGSSFLLFLIGAFSGIYAIYILSKCLNRLDNSFVRNIGGGTLVILGLHYVIILVLRMMGVLHNSTLLDYTIALLILFAFYPIIVLVKKHMPLLYGSYRKNISK